MTGECSVSLALVVFSTFPVMNNYYVNNCFFQERTKAVFQVWLVKYSKPEDGPQGGDMPVEKEKHPSGTAPRKNKAVASRAESTLYHDVMCVYETERKGGNEAKGGKG